MGVSTTQRLVENSQLTVDAFDSDFHDNICIYVTIPASATQSGSAVRRQDLTHQLASSRTNSQSFSGSADYPTYWVPILVGRIV